MTTNRDLVTDARLDLATAVTEEAAVIWEDHFLELWERIAAWDPVLGDDLKNCAYLWQRTQLGIALGIPEEIHYPGDGRRWDRSAPATQSEPPDVA